MNGEEHQVVIVGAGIAGLATALGLRRLGIRSLVLERSDGIRLECGGLGLFPNAWRALDALGVTHKLYPYYSGFQSSRNHIKDLVSGVTVESTYTGTGRSTKAALAVPRKALLEALAEELPADYIRFSSKVVSINSEILPDSSNISVIGLEDGVVLRAKILIGCDGVHSIVAKWLGLSAPVLTDQFGIQGLATISEGHIYQRDIYQYLKDDKRLGIFPITDTMVLWFISYLSIPNEKEIARDPELIRREVIDNIGKDFQPEFLEIVRRTDTSTLKWVPLMFRYPWDIIFGPTSNGNVVVAGDAMHPITPHLAQGGCVALEDAIVLVRCICSNKDTHEGIKKYVRERRWRVAGIVTAAYITGRVQLGSNWAMKWFRDNIYYWLIFPKVIDAMDYDCGALSTIM